MLIIKHRGWLWHLTASPLRLLEFCLFRVRNEPSRAMLAPADPMCAPASACRELHEAPCACVLQVDMGV